MNDTSHFVNPYAFVPLPQEVRRSEPQMHSGWAPDGPTRYSGTVTVRWNLRTPMLLPRNFNKEGWVAPDGTLRIPGSSIKGAVRSLHEAMFHGCYRIVDEDFLPAYREPAQPDGKDSGDWRLAIVESPPIGEPDGRPSRVRLCDAIEDVVWVDGSELHRAWQGADVPRSGDLALISGPVETSTLNRKEMRSVSSAVAVSSVGEIPVEARVILVTSVGARRAYTRSGRKGRAFWATGRLTDTVLDVDRDGPAVTRFRQACAGTDDRRRLSAKDATEGDAWRRERVFEEVVWWTTSGAKRRIARRAKASGNLFPGDVVWVRLSGETNVEEIKLARIWRRVGGDASLGVRLGQRTPTSAHPCQPKADPPHLCLTCAIFGAADTDGDNRGKGQNAAYAGHVSFGSARTKTAVTLETVHLAPMGTPNPGSGMFYLQNPSDLPRVRPRGEVASHWGSDLGNPVSRPIAGRKFYWHSDPDAQATYWARELKRPIEPRYKAAPSQRGTAERENRMSSEATLVPAGTELTAHVAIDGLDATSIHTLLAVLDPARLFSLVAEGQGRTFATHLGGGKPLGLGTATVSLQEKDVDLEESAARYGVPAQKVEWLAERFPYHDVQERTGPLTGGMPQLIAMLDVNGLGTEKNLVAYPPGTGWESLYGSDPRAAEEFHRSFEFFQRANGERLRDRSRPWHPLPEPGHGRPQSLPIERRPR